MALLCFAWYLRRKPCTEGTESERASGDYLAHQEDVVTRRTKYDLNKAQERAHILEGLLKALDNIDEVIRIIRGSRMFR